MLENRWMSIENPAERNSFVLSQEFHVRDYRNTVVPTVKLGLVASTLGDFFFQI
jgi:hypothetical protein